MAESSPEGAADDAPRKADAAVASTAGRGVLYIAGAKFWFMIAGLVIQLRLPVLLSRAVFGAYGVVRSVVSPVNNVMITGSIQAVSRFTAQRPELARAVQRSGLRMHLYVGLPLAIAFIAGAPVVSWWFNDPAKTAPLMLAGVIVGGYSFYAVFIGTANGQREFHKQAGLDVTFSTLRMVGILGMAMAGFGLIGVVGGWVAAVGVIMFLAVAWVGLPGKAARADRRRPDPPDPDLLRRGRDLPGPAQRADVRRHLAAQAADRRLVPTPTRPTLGAALHRALPWAPQVTGFHYDPAQLADVQVAYYTAVQTLARLSYQAIIAATFVVFPLVSRLDLRRRPRRRPGATST